MGMYFSPVLELLAGLWCYAIILLSMIGVSITSVSVANIVLKSFELTILFWRILCVELVSSPFVV